MDSKDFRPRIPSQSRVSDNDMSPAAQGTPPPTRPVREITPIVMDKFQNDFADFRPHLIGSNEDIKPDPKDSSALASAASQELSTVTESESSAGKASLASAEKVSMPPKVSGLSTPPSLNVQKTGHSKQPVTGKT